MLSGKIFRSRWSALFWAAGIVWTAYDVASANSPSTDHATPHVQHQAATDSGAAADPDSAKDLAILQQYANSGK